MISKVFNYFGYDGLKHVIASNVMVVVLNLILPLWVAVLVTVLAGVGKEIVWDKLIKNMLELKKIQFRIIRL